MDTRTLAIGDIHGDLLALDALLDAVEVTPNDVVITLGDYVDRGPDSAGVIERMLELSTRCSLVPLLGNHDLVMIDACRNPDDDTPAQLWAAMGGTATIASYGSRRIDAIPERHVLFLEECRLVHEDESHLYVHGGLDPHVPPDEQVEAITLWRRVEETQPHQSGKPVVCGHSSQRSGLPLDLGHAVCIDTLVGGWLTCLFVDTGVCVQANGAGEARSFSLDDDPMLS